MEYTREHRVLIQQREINYLENKIAIGKEKPYFKEHIEKLKKIIEEIKCGKR